MPLIVDIILRSHFPVPTKKRDLQSPINTEIICLMLALDTVQLIRMHDYNMRREAKDKHTIL